MNESDTPAKVGSMEWLGVVNVKEQTMLTSCVRGHEGDCKPVWLNRNQLCNRLDGGVTGFFRRVERLTWWPHFAVKVGPEFHGIVRNGVVRTTMPGSDA